MNDPPAQPPDFAATRPAILRPPPSPKKRMAFFSRRNFFRGCVGLGLVGLGGWGYAKYEAGNLEVHHIALPKERFSSSHAFRILHLSDFQFSPEVPLALIEEAIVLGLAEKPDLCFLTGDFISATLSEEEFGLYAKSLSKLTAAVPKTFACLGNHDGGEWAASHGGYPTTQKVETLLAEAKVHLLQNQRTLFYVKGQPITLVGLGDLWAKRCLPDKCLPKHPDAPASLSEPPVILLSHNPDSKELLRTHHWDLMLSGHTHGGQFRVPFLDSAPFAPVEDHDLLDGLHIWEEHLVHITRGVGNLYGIRFNCRPQVSILEVETA